MSEYVFQWSVGDRVLPRTPAGLYLADRPSSGLQHGARGVVGVLREIGEIIETRDVLTDYDQWEGYVGLGSVVIQNCLVRTSWGEGWAGALALIRAE